MMSLVYSVECRYKLPVIDKWATTTKQCCINLVLIILLTNNDPQPLDRTKKLHQHAESIESFADWNWLLEVLDEIVWIYHDNTQNTKGITIHTCIDLEWLCMQCNVMGFFQLQVCHFSSTLTKKWELFFASVLICSICFMVGHIFFLFVFMGGKIHSSPSGA